MGDIFRVMVLLAILTTTALAQQVMPRPTSDQKKDLKYYVGIALTQAFEDLRLGAAEKKIFESEVLPDGLLFVTGYGTTLEGTDVQVDRRKLQNYLRFVPGLFASGASGSEIPSVCVTVRASPQCASCVSIQAQLQDETVARFAKRGFNAKIGLSVSDEASLSGERALDFLAARSAEARCDGVAYLEILPESAEEADAGAVKIKTLGFLQMKNKSGQKIRGRSSSAHPVPTVAATQTSDENRTIASMAAKQTSDLFSVVAGQTSLASAQAKTIEEKYLKLEGVVDFATYARFKQMMATSLPDVKLEERFMRPGVIEFAIGDDRGLMQLANELKRMSSIEVLRVGVSELAVVMK